MTVLDVVERSSTCTTEFVKWNKISRYLVSNISLSEQNFRKKIRPADMAMNL